MPEDEIATAPLNNLDFIAHNADIYGEAPAYLASQSDDSELLSVFSYDWRRDYAYAAARLQEFVCSNRATFEGHKIYVIAHSMGGLVLKYWHKNFRNMDCMTGESTTRSGLISARRSFLERRSMAHPPHMRRPYVSGMERVMSA